MKKTIIATAVSAALMAPVAAQAEVTVYGRIHQGIKLVNPEKGDSTTDFVSVGSRFGIKASSDVGNGMTASAHYEFTTSADTPGKGVANTRHALVGVSGGFGSVSLGNQWGAYYNNVGVHVDPTYSVGGWAYYFGDSSTFGPVRTPNTIKYANSFGPVSLELDARLDDGKDGGDIYGGDGHAIGVTVALNDNITFAAGTDNTEGKGEYSGAAVKVSLGNFWASLATHKVKADNAEPGDPEFSANQLWVGGSFGNTSAMIGTGRVDFDIDDNLAGNDPSDFTVGVYHSLGGGLNLLYEGHKLDSDGLGADKTTHLLGIRLDF